MALGYQPSLHVSEGGSSASQPVEEGQLKLQIVKLQKREDCCITELFMKVLNYKHNNKSHSQMKHLTYLMIIYLIEYMMMYILMSTALLGVEN